MSEVKSVSLASLAEQLSGALEGALTQSKIVAGELTVTVEPARILDVLGWLKGPGEFKILVDLCGTDWPQREKRFDVVYHLLSLTRNLRIRVKAMLGDGEAIKSAIGIYPAAGWFEREAFDMYGIAFEDHPDLRRILTDYGFSGFPLRKDFPLTGYVELRYDDELKRVVYQPVKLVQEFRDFDFMSPWEGAPHILPGDEKAAMAPGATSGDTGKKP
jgi:NADH-quinone oxidoreductase subunit C